MTMANPNARGTDWDDLDPMAQELVLDALRAMRAGAEKEARANTSTPVQAMVMATRAQEIIDAAIRKLRPRS